MRNLDKHRHYRECHDRCSGPAEYLQSPRNNELPHDLGIAGHVHHYSHDRRGDDAIDDRGKKQRFDGARCVKPSPMPIIVAAAMTP